MPYSSVEDKRAWNLAHRWEKRAVRHHKRARDLGRTVYLVTERDWLRLVERYRHCCAYCGEPSSALTMDHVIPLHRGGHHSIGNLLPACLPCNDSKGALLLVEWLYRKQVEEEVF